ncbi:MAG: methyltransferase domain-containing protein [Burkholderiales bacterium]
MKESYTPGHSERAIAFMSRRRLTLDGAYFRPFLRPGMSVLDCGCGPGTITCDIAREIAPGRAIGVDASAAQVELAGDRAKSQGVGNAAFRQADVYALPFFADDTFDAVFCNALLEHLAEPQRAVDQFFRVLKPGGVLGVSTPYWGGFLVAPPTPTIQAAFDAYRQLQIRNGGDPYVGRKLGDFLEASGFEGIDQRARYENYAPLTVITDFLALNLEHAGDPRNAQIWRTFGQHSRGMFAQAWVSCTGRKLDG